RRWARYRAADRAHRERQRFACRASRSSARRSRRSPRAASATRRADQGGVLQSVMPDRSRSSAYLSPLIEQEIDKPAAANMGTGTAAMAQDVGIGAAGIFEGVGKDGKARCIKRPLRQSAFVVDCLCQTWNDSVLPGLPGGIDAHGTEGISEDTPQQ